MTAMGETKAVIDIGMAVWNPTHFYFPPSDRGAMKYSMMAQLYPWINELFEVVEEQVHGGMDPHRAIAHLQDNHAIELGRISDRHLGAVTDKLRKWAETLYKNDGYYTPVERPEHPGMCPWCGSIDISGSRCWCRSPVQAGREVKRCRKLRIKSRLEACLTVSGVSRMRLLCAVSRQYGQAK